MALINQGDINSFMRRENGEKLFEFRIVMDKIKHAGERFERLILVYVLFCHFHKAELPSLRHQH